MKVYVLIHNPGWDVASILGVYANYYAAIQGRETHSKYSIYNDLDIETHEVQ